MTGLLAALFAQGVGVALSPLAVVVLLALLGTRHAGVNGLAFLGGWVLAVSGVLAGAYLLADAFGGGKVHEPPGWLAPVHLVLAALLLVGAVVIWRRGRAKVLQTALAPTASETVVAAPTLPAWLGSVDSFRPARCFLLGVAAFVLNPVDLSCTIGAALDLATTPVGTPGRWAGVVLFLVVGSAAVGGPVVWYRMNPDRAARSLQRLQTWIARRTNLVNAVVIAIVGIMQLTKGLQGL